MPDNGVRAAASPVAIENTETTENNETALAAFRTQSSPIVELIGHEVTKLTEGHAQVELEVRKALTNRGGAIHGGIYCLLMDTVGGYAGVYSADPGKQRTFITLTLTTNFLGQPKGKRMIATGRLRAAGRSTFFSDIEIHDELGNLLATGSGSFKYREIK